MTAHGACFFHFFMTTIAASDETDYHCVGYTFAPHCLTSIFARCFRCSLSTWPTASSRLSSSAGSRFSCSLNDAASALAWHASAFLTAATASISIASARAARAVAVAAAEAPSAAESEAACRQSRLQPRNTRALSLSWPTRVSLTETCNAGKGGECRSKLPYRSICESGRLCDAARRVLFPVFILTRVECS